MFLNLSDICYKKNFLKEVIARIDLVSPEESLINELPKPLNNTALKKFPIAEPKNAFVQGVQLGPKHLHTSRREFTEWNFYGRKREKRLTITPDFFSMSYNTYEKYELLRDEFNEFVRIYFEQCENSQPSRLGLRYINNIHIKKNNLLDWTGYINSKLLGLFNLKITESQPSRIFHTYEVSFDSFNLRFQFGMHNPDYPAPIRRNIFILDYDAYFQGLIESTEIIKNLDIYHAEIQKLFEFSIDTKLRKKLNEE